MERVSEYKSNQKESTFYLMVKKRFYSIEVSQEEFIPLNLE
jgi:hypothetical protein